MSDWGDCSDWNIGEVVSDKPLIHDRAKLEDKFTSEFFNIDGSDEGVFGTPYLVQACKENLVDIINLLIEHKANPNVLFTNGETPLHILLRSFPDSPAVETLILKSNLFIKDVKGVPAILSCNRKQFQNFVVEPLRKRVEIDLEYFFVAKTLLGHSISYALSHNRMDYVEEIKRLLPYIVDDNFLQVVDKNLSKVVKEAIKENNTNEFQKIYQNLKKYDVTRADKQGLTSLNYAADFVNLYFLEQLLKLRDIDVNYKAIETPLHTACRVGNMDAVTFLIENSADPTLTNSSSNNFSAPYPLHQDTPLHLAARAGHYECCLYLITFDSSLVLLTNQWKNLPLHLALLSNKNDIVQLLLQYDPDSQVNSKNSKGETSLHFAYKYSEESVDLLLSHGANPTIRNDAGLVPQQMQKNQNQDQNQNLRSSSNRLRNSSSSANNRSNNNQNRNNSNRGQMNKPKGGKNKGKNNSRGGKNNTSTSSFQQQGSSNSLIASFDEPGKCEEEWPVLNEDVNKEEPVVQKEPIKVEPQPGKKLEELEEELQDLKLCSICIENPKDTLFQPCYHLSVCQDCANAIVEKGGGLNSPNSLCPMCRTPITGLVQVFIS